MATRPPSSASGRQTHLDAGDAEPGIGPPPQKDARHPKAVERDLGQPVDIDSHPQGRPQPAFDDRRRQPPAALDLQGAIDDPGGQRQAAGHGDGKGDGGEKGDAEGGSSRHLKTPAPG
jgi:hypothetical protein